VGLIDRMRPRRQKKVETTIPATEGVAKI